MTNDFLSKKFFRWEKVFYLIENSNDGVKNKNVIIFLFSFKLFARKLQSKKIRNRTGNEKGQRKEGI